MFATRGRIMTPVAKRLSDEELRARISPVAWLHSLWLRPGITTPGTKSVAVLAEEEAFLGPSDLRGRFAAHVVVPDHLAWSLFRAGRQTRRRCCNCRGIWASTASCIALIPRRRPRGASTRR